MQLNLYTIINFYCVVICSLVLFHRVSNKDRTKEDKLFNCLILSSILFFFFDGIWGMFGTYFNLTKFASYIVNVFYYTFIGLSAYLWFIYSEIRQESVLVKKRLFLILCTIPLIIYEILVIISGYTNSIFYLDDIGNYFRGDLYLIQWIECYGYMGFTSIKALTKAYKKENFSLKSKYTTLGVFLIFPALSGPMQLVLIGAPAVSLGTALAILQAQMHFQRDLISLDYLTQVNNRGELLKHLSLHMNERENLILYMLDLDGFKNINDRYGHLEGDKSLVRVAEVLKKYCAERNYFIARYGGDEFVIVCQNRDSLELRTLEDEINSELFKYNAHMDNNYELHISVGMAIYDSTIKSIPDFIEKADFDLYRNKEARKAAK